MNVITYWLWPILGGVGNSGLGAYHGGCCGFFLVFFHFLPFVCDAYVGKATFDAFR